MTPYGSPCPTGASERCPPETTGLELARQIGPGLARAALAIRVNGQIRDLSRPLGEDATVSILTDRDPDALELLRHSAAHVLATAVRELFPGAGIGFGPPIEDGFYYDFEVPRPFTPEDLEQIEIVMREVAGKDYPFVREVVDREEANRRFADDPLKLERIAELGPDETITVYTDGPFVDLCRGPHIPGDRPAQALQAAPRCRRLLAGRREAADAAAHLRHGLVQEGGPGRLPRTAGRIAQAGPPPRRQGAGPVHVPSVRARVRCSGPIGARR